MHPLKSTKGILFLSILIVVLYLSQYAFPDPPEKDNPEISPEQIEKTIEDPKEQGPSNDVKDVIPDTPSKESSAKDPIDLKSRTVASKKDISIEDQVLIEKIMSPEMIQYLIDELDSFEINDSIVNVQKISNDSGEYNLTTYQNGARVKQGETDDGGLAYVYAGGKEKFIRNFYESGQIREYFYYNDAEGIANGITYFENGKVLARFYRNGHDSKFIRVTYSKNGTIKKVESR